MRVYIINTPLKGIGKFLNDVGMLLNITAFGAVGGVGNVAGFHAAGSHHIAGPFLFQCSGGRFKFNGEIPLAAGKRGCCGAEVDTLIDIHICFRIQTLLLQDIFENHFRHSAFAAAKNIFPFQITPFKVRHFLPGHHKIPGPLGSLREVDHRIIGAFQIGVHGRLRAHKADLGIPGNDGGHHLVGAVAVHQIQLDSLLLKISFLNGHILGRVEDGMSHLIEGHLHGFLLLAVAGGSLRFPGIRLLLQRFGGFRLLAAVFSASRKSGAGQCGHQPESNPFLFHKAPPVSCRPDNRGGSCDSFRIRVCRRAGYVRPRETEQNRRGLRACTGRAKGKDQTATGFSRKPGNPLAGLEPFVHNKAYGHRKRAP